MKFRRHLPVFIAAVLAFSCLPAAAVFAADGSESGSGQHEIYIPDFPQEVLDAFNIDWTGLGENQRVDNDEFSEGGTGNKCSHNGGYSLFSTQGGGGTIAYAGYWYDCDDFNYYSYASYSDPDNYSYNSPVMESELFTNIQCMTDFRAGPLLTLDNGSAELFVIERFTAAPDMSADEKLGTYTVGGISYDLYRKAAADEGKVSYWAVNAEGEYIAPSVEGASETFSTPLSDHLTELKKLTGAGERLERYGFCMDGCDGRGNGFIRSTLVKDDSLPPEEELLRDDDGRYRKYDNNISKLLGGCYYELNADDGVSSVTPMENGTFTAEIDETQHYSVFAGRVFDGSENVLDHNYRLNYEFTSSDSYDMCIAKVCLADPETTMNFYELFDDEEDIWAVMGYTAGYAGRIELMGETYEVYTNHFNMPTGFGWGEPVRYDIVHRNAPVAPQEVRKGSIPLYALISASCHYGLNGSKLSSITFGTRGYGRKVNISVLKNELTEDSTSVLDNEDALKLYADMDIKSASTTIDAYTFLCDSTYKASMTAYTEGRFSAETRMKCDNSFSGGYDFGVDVGITDEEDYAADYSASCRFDGKYYMGYSVSMVCGDLYEPLSMYVIENSAGMTSGDIFDSLFPPSFNTNSTSLLSSEYLGVYSADGHEYDLHKALFENRGCFSSSTVCVFLAVRRDQQADSTALSGHINLSRHLAQPERKGGNIRSLRGIEFFVSVRDAEGSVSVDKNNIYITEAERGEGEKNIDQVLAGDFNNDGCVDSFDVISAKKLLVSKLSDKPVKAERQYDLNNNGTFEVADVVTLQSYVIGRLKTLS